MAVKEYTEKSFAELTGNEKSTFSFLRLFNILQSDKDELLFLNIFRSYTIDDTILNNVSFFETYEVANGEFWDNISYNLYETVGLWWVIAVLNNILNPFEELEDGQILTVLRDEYVYQLVADLERISDN